MSKRARVAVVGVLLAGTAATLAACATPGGASHADAEARQRFVFDPAHGRLVDVGEPGMVLTEIKAWQQQRRGVGQADSQRPVAVATAATHTVVARGESVAAPLASPGKALSVVMKKGRVGKPKTLPVSGAVAQIPPAELEAFVRAVVASVDGDAVAAGSKAGKGVDAKASLQVTVTMARGAAASEVAPAKPQGGAGAAASGGERGGKPGEGNGPIRLGPRPPIKAVPVAAVALPPSAPVVVRGATTGLVYEVVELAYFSPDD